MSINTIITTLLTQLSKISPPPAGENENDNLNLHHNHQHQHQHQHPSNRNNIFTNLSPTDTTQLKNLLLTLHCLFPNELLLALDILDRGFIMRYAYYPDKHSRNMNLGDENDDMSIFIVQSTSNQDRDSGGAGAGAGAGRGKVYHVHLKTWNCSCAAFVLNCFPASSSSTSNNDDADEHNDMMDSDNMFQGQSDGGDQAWFGSTIRNRETSYDDRAVPVCKHILACVLVAKCPNLFGSKCLTYKVDKADTDRVNEVAGWCAA